MDTRWYSCRVELAGLRKGTSSKKESESSVIKKTDSLITLSNVVICWG